MVGYSVNEVFVLDAVLLHPCFELSVEPFDVKGRCESFATIVAHQVETLFDLRIAELTIHLKADSINLIRLEIILAE
jgi:hypothetical protein